MILLYGRPVFFGWGQDLGEWVFLVLKEYLFQSSYGIHAVKLCRLQHSHNYAVILRAGEGAVAVGYLPEYDIGPNLLLSVVIVVINVFYV